MDQDKLEDLTRQLIAQLDEEPNRNGLDETPARVARFYKEYFTPKDFKMTTFPSEGYDEMIVQLNIPFYSLCEHHMVPFFGTGAIAYIPHNKIVGLSKLTRTLDYFASRLQNQERITMQVANFLNKHLDPQGVAVTLEARHLCMEMRGVKKAGTSTTTSSLTGIFKEHDPTRDEFFKIIKMSRA